MQHYQLSLDTQIKFLVISSRMDLSDSDIYYIEEFLKSYLTVDREKDRKNHLLILANRHGVLPIVYKSLRSINFENVEMQQKLDDLIVEFKSTYLMISQKNILISSELMQISKKFKESGIVSYSFKGPSLAKMVYGDITLRQYSDIDILIDPKDLLLAEKIAQDRGYRSLYPKGTLSDTTCLNTLADVGLWHNGVHIELHWRLFPSKYIGKKPFDGMEDFQKTIWINDQSIDTFSDELLLVYLSFHGSKHAWERIAWICDIDRVIRVQDVNLEEALVISQGYKLHRAFYLGIGLANELLGTPLSNTILAKIKKQNIGKLIDKTIYHLNKTIKSEDEFSKNRDLFFYQMHLFKLPIDRFNFILDSTLSISPQDCLTYTIPHRFRYLYIILRPMRLFLRLFNPKS